jgi:predicted ester cyclase
MSEENKAIARRVYEIISTGDFERAEEIVDASAPDNECSPGMVRPRLIGTFKETFSEARQAFPDAQVTVEDVMAEDDMVAARVVMRGTHRGEFQGIAPPASGSRFGRSTCSASRTERSSSTGATPTIPPLPSACRSSHDL